MTVSGISRAVSRVDALRSLLGASPEAEFSPVLAAAGETGAGGTAARSPLPAGAARWEEEITRAADAAGVDPRLLTALVWSESGFDPAAVSPAGAVGLSQLMPATAEGLGVDPTDPAENLAGGARYLSDLISRFGGVELALAAYNAGPGRVAAAGTVPSVAEGYVRTVLDRYRSLGGSP